MSPEVGYVIYIASFLHFELLIEVLAQKLTDLWHFQNLTYFLTSWPGYWTFDLKTTDRCAVLGYICGPSLVTIEKLRLVSWKMWQFNLYMNIEDRFWRHAVTSSVTSSTSKLFSGVISDEKFVLQYVKLTNPPSFQTWFPKSGPTYRRQVVNPRHQTPQGNQSQSLELPCRELSMT